jgi:hypothetical protein
VTRAPISSTLRTGFGGVTNFNYSGKYLGVNGHFDHFDSDFRNADLGFLSSRANKNEADGGLNLGNPNPWRMFRSTNTGVYVNRQWNDDGLVFGSSVGFNQNLNFMDYWNINFGDQHNFTRYDDLNRAAVRPSCGRQGTRSIST